MDATQPGKEQITHSEHIPILMWGPDIKDVNIGGRSTFADIGQTIAAHFGLKLKNGAVCPVF